MQDKTELFDQLFHSAQGQPRRPERAQSFVDYKYSVHLDLSFFQS